MVAIELQQYSYSCQHKLQVRNILGEEGEKAELLCSGPTLAMELVMEDAVSKFAQLASAKVAFPKKSHPAAEHSRGVATFTHC